MVGDKKTQWPQAKVQWRVSVHETSKRIYTMQNAIKELEDKFMAQMGFGESDDDGGDRSNRSSELLSERRSSRLLCRSAQPEPRQRQILQPEPDRLQRAPPSETSALKILLLARPTFSRSPTRLNEQSWF